MPLLILPLAFYVIAQFSVAVADPLMRGLPDLAWAKPARAPDEVGGASRYGGPGDSRWGGQGLACAPDHKVEAGMHVCAHRTHRCGTVLLVQSVRTGRTTLCRVMDRGPYGACTRPMVRRRCPRGAWRVEIRLQPGSVRRGFLDLAFTTYAALGLRGISPVRAWVLEVPRRPIRVRPARRPTS